MMGEGWWGSQAALRRGLGGWVLGGSQIDLRRGTGDDRVEDFLFFSQLQKIIPLPPRQKVQQEAHIVQWCGGG